MPYADTVATVRSWSEERAIAVWTLFAGDIPTSAISELAADIEEVRRDGASVVLVVSDDVTPTSMEKRLADIVVRGPIPPSPFGLLVALAAADVPDVRKMGLIGGSSAALEAGQRAGAGAVIGIASSEIGGRLHLLPGQPDRIVEPSDFATMDELLYGRNRPHRERVLLNPGPAVVSDRIHRAVAGPDLCHREPEYSAMFARIREKLFRVARVSSDWELALIAGSGTAAMEAMIGSSVREGRHLLVCRNGVYGDRLATIGERLGIDTLAVHAAQTQPIDPSVVASALDADPDIDAVAIVHHETTTGLLNPVHKIAAIAADRGVRVIVDAISSLGAEELRPGTEMDMIACTSNKCLHGLPGTSFVLLSPAGAARVAESPRRSLYLDIAGYLAAQKKDSVPFTPAIPAVYGLEAALDELLDQGLTHRQAAYRARVGLLDEAFARMGLTPSVDAQNRSSSVRSLPLPTGVAYEDLHDALKRDGYVIYAGLGDAAKTTFRVCTLGAMELEVLSGFVESLERALAEAKSVGRAGEHGEDPQALHAAAAAVGA
ncbi:MAG TPA: aminotransferase class V-fold PLP-dependent enzyme [Candidatus Limnocylindrales bacterium]